MTTSFNVRARFGAALLATLVLIAGVYGCDSNAWSELPTGGSKQLNDQEDPNVALLAPDSAGRVAVGDSLLVRVQVADDVAIDSVRLSGYALRGSADLGTQQRVERFVSKKIEFTRLSEAVRDTMVERFLMATSDSLPEDSVFLTAIVWDAAGNAREDRTVISVGGPRLQIVAPANGSTIRAGTELAVQVSAADSIGRIQQVSVRLVGDDFEVLEAIEIDPPAGRVDTTLIVDVPEDASGQVSLSAHTRTMTNDSTRTTPLLLDLSAAGRDNTAPRVSFTLSGVGRVEMDDTVRIKVSASDSTKVARIGATIRPSLRLPGSVQELALWIDDAAADSAEFRIALSDLGAVEPKDTSYVMRLELAAFAFDTAGNCAVATVPGTPLSVACPEGAGDEVTAKGTGYRADAIVVRGATTHVGAPEDRLVDLVADSVGRRVFVSNLSRNRVEVLGFGQDRFGAPISVGSEPWGLAIGRSHDTMYVANSGGTNISVVPLKSGSLKESWRISTSNVRLYSFDYDVKTDSVSGMAEHDYSDRPQFLGQIQSGQLVYSTKPTTARADGTIRIFDAKKDTTSAYNRGSEILTSYAIDGKSEGKGVVVNALEVDVVDAMLWILPRPVQASDPPLAPIHATPTAARLALETMRGAGLTDTRVDLYLDVEDVGLTDTTFVAVSRDHKAVAFGEGAANPGRVLMFRNDGEPLTGRTVDTDDLVGNAAERVVGLSLNVDGTLGVARGSQSYFFNEDLRLQGVVESGRAGGGVALHPSNANYPDASTPRVAFVSGVDDDGLAYVDIVDSYSFRQLRRIPIREPITGSLTAVAVGAGDPDRDRYALRLFGITAGGVVEIGITEGDLR